MLKTIVACLAAILSGLVSPCRGQCSSSSGPPIKVASGPLNGPLTVIDCAADGADISISVSGLSGDRVLHIFNSDIADNPQFDIGRISIAGNSSTLVSLVVLVADEFAPWDEISTTFLNPACANFGGLIVSDAATLAKTRCSIAVSGTVEHRGSDPAAADVFVNQVVRIQATGPINQQTGLTSTGTINANIVAAATGPTFLEFDPHIGHIRAGDKIVGRIEALSGDIGTVRVVGDPTVTPAPGGIRGDIMALGGKIGAIYSTGDIDSKNPSHLMRIHAMQNIDEIRAAPEQSTLQFEPVVQRNLIADIQAGINWTLVPDPTDPTVFQPDNNAAIQNINIGGDIEGSIKAKNLSFFGNGFRSGIIAGGTIAAAIDIECNVEQVDIIAATFTAAGGIKVGVRLEGSIVATSPGGRIPFVDVGHGSSADANAFAQTWVRGFCGNERRPFSPTATEPENLFNYDDWYIPFPCTTGGCIDTVIRADSIGEVRLVAMTVKFADVSGPGGDLAKPFPPRIESPVIDRLEVTDLRNGIIWSGNLDLQVTDVEERTDEVDDNFATIASLDIGCVGYGGSLWLDGTNDINIASDMLGKVRMPGLTSGKTIRIGGRLGDWTQFCGCEPLGTTCLFQPLEGIDSRRCVTFDERSAREAQFDDGLNTDSFVIIGAGTLKGQIIINRNNTAAPTADAFWRGFVNRDSNPDVVLATDSTDPTTIAP